MSASRFHWQHGMWLGATELRTAEVARSGDRIVVQLRWREPRGEAEFFYGLTVRDGRIVHIKDSRSRRDAEKRVREAA